MSRTGRSAGDGGERTGGGRTGPATDGGRGRRTGPAPAGDARSGPPPDRTCDRCGRTITWRKKWERDWDAVRWCSQGCRSAGLGETDRALERTVLELLAARARDATICPSEAARAVGGEDWRPLMEPARSAARRLVARGEVEITQGGRVVDGSTARGPIRVRRAR